jgi:transposase InsO family protein
VEDALDNAAMETFGATLKRERAWTYGTTHFTTRSALRTALFDYIEILNNHQRHHAGLDHLSPTEYETLGVP